MNPSPYLKLTLIPLNHEIDHWFVTAFSSERGRMEPPVLLNTSTVVVAESIHDRAMLGSPVTWSGM